jgi:phosphonate transport system substrate-binding protein
MLLCLLICTTATHAAIDQASVIRVGITTVTARNQYALLEDWRNYLQERLHQPVELVFRESYSENIDLMNEKKLDFAWFSAPAYLENRHLIELVVTPSYHGKPYDRSYLIVSAGNTETHSLLALKDGIFAYVDSDSCTGYLQPRQYLRQKNLDPDNYFKKTFFTHDHQKIVAAVAIGLADAGSMSGYAWETLAKARPDITAQTRIVAKSTEYGFPPIVARRTLSRSKVIKLRQVLLTMATDAAGKQILEQMSLDGFLPANPNIYLPITQLMPRAK